MDAKVYEELDEAKSEIQNLKKQYKVKSELAEGLKRAHGEQLIKSKETSSKLEKLSQELNQKNDEIYEASQVHEALKAKLAEKESIIKQISSSHDKLRSDYSQNIKKLEEENRSLASALDEATAHSLDQEQKISSLMQEIEGVKRLLDFPEKKKCSEKESKKNYEAKEDEYFKLGDEKTKLEDQLKWKKEQFVHLEEAHRKLKNEVKNKEKEWQKERNALLDGISTLQTDFEARVRISQDFERRLEMCNQALAHAEGKRKLLEAQLTEARRNFDGVCAEYDEAKANFEDLSLERDQEIANLRSSLGSKEILYKEMEYQFKKLEQENLDLSVSLKELQEAQIREASSSYSSSKIQNKLKAKESEWWAKEEKLTEELNSCKSDLKKREREVMKLESLTKAKKSEWQAQEEKLLEELNSCKLELKNIEREIDELKSLTKAEKSEWQSREERLSEELNSCKLELKNKEREILELELLKTKESEWRDQEERLSEELNSCKLELKSREREILELEFLKAKQSEWRAQEERLSEELNSCELELKNREREILELEFLKAKQSEWLAQEERLSEELNSCKLELKNRKREILELEFLKAKQSEWQAQEERLSKELNSCKLELKNIEGEILELELLKVKQSEWQAMEEKLSEELNSLESELKKKEKVIHELELLNQETSLSLLILKSELCCMNSEKREMVEENMHKLVQQLEEEKKALRDEREKVVVLSALPEEMERLKGMLGVQSEEHAVRLQSENKKSEKLSEELNRCRSELRIRNDSVKELNRELEACYSQILELELINQETSLTLMVLKSEFPRVNLKNRESLVRIFEDLETRRLQCEENLVQMQSEYGELYEKLCETSDMEFELQAWKSTAEQLEVSLERSLEMRREVEASLFAQMEVEMSLRQEREDLIHQLEENEKGKTVQSEEENEAFAQFEVDIDENTPEKAERIYQLVEEKEQRIYDLQQQVASLEKEFESSTATFSSNLSRMQKERNFLSESWEKIKSDKILKEMEIQEKNAAITELENDLRDLGELVDQQEKKIQEARAELEKKELEVRKLECELKIEVESSEKTIEELRSENEKLGSAIRFVSDKMDELNVEEDVKLLESLGKIVEAFDMSPESNNVEDDEDDDLKENVSCVFSSSPLMKTVEGIRSPLRAINN